MRALFSLVGLLIVVAVIAMLAKKQLQAVAPAVVPAAPVAADGSAPTVPEQSRAAQQKVLQDVNRALEQGATRGSDSKP
jgi:Tfp pilus assembly major pilin PilA